MTTMWVRKDGVTDEVTNENPFPVELYGPDGQTLSATQPGPVYNTTLTTADTQYSRSMPAGCRRFEFQCRTSSDVRFAFETGKVATPTAPYMTLKAGTAYDSGPVNQGGAPSTLFLASSTAGVVVEILSWL